MSEHDSTCAPIEKLQGFDPLSLSFDDFCLWKAWCQRHWRTHRHYVTTKSLKRKPGVYVIIGDRQVQYIGSSCNIRQRLTGRLPNVVHTEEGAIIRTVWGDFDEFELKIRYSTKYGDWLMRELRLIRRLRPIHNAAGEGAQRKIVVRRGSRIRGW